LLWRTSYFLSTPPYEQTAAIAGAHSGGAIHQPIATRCGGWPSWRETVEVLLTQLDGDSSRVPIHRHHRRTWLLGGALVLVFTLIGSIWIVRQGHPGGDPGGQMLNRLKATTAGMLPPGADVREHVTVEASWETCAAGDGGPNGWIGPSVRVEFATSLPVQQVISRFKAGAIRNGWGNLTISYPDGVHYPPGPLVMNAHANLGVGSPFFLQITAGYDSPVSVPWLLTASATPKGQKAECV